MKELFGLIKEIFRLQRRLKYLKMINREINRHNKLKAKASVSMQKYTKMIRRYNEHYPDNIMQK